MHVLVLSMYRDFRNQGGRATGLPARRREERGPGPRSSSAASAEAPSVPMLLSLRRGDCLTKLVRPQKTENELEHAEVIHRKSSPLFTGTKA